MVLDLDDLANDTMSAVKNILGHIDLKQSGVWPDTKSNVAAANTGVELSRLPRWVVLARKNRRVSDLLRILPRPAVKMVRRILSLVSGCRKPRVPKDIIARFEG